MIDSAIAVHVIMTWDKGINDDGLIVANGVDSRRGETHACLLSELQGDYALPHRRQPSGLTVSSNQ
jgi:hypothetical protein